MNTAKQLFKELTEDKLIEHYTLHKDSLKELQEDATPVHLAIVQHKLKLIDFLVSNKADFNVKNSFGLTPFSSAAHHVFMNQYIDALIADGAKADEYDSYVNAISNALNNYNFDFFKILQKYPLNYTGVFRDKKTLAHFSTVVDEREILDFLLKQGVDFVAVDLDGKTPQDYAKANKNELFLEFLKDNQLLAVPAPKKTAKKKPAKKAVKAK